MYHERYVKYFIYLDLHFIASVRLWLVLNCQNEMLAMCYARYHSLIVWIKNTKFFQWNGQYLMSTSNDIELIRFVEFSQENLLNVMSCGCYYLAENSKAFSLLFVRNAFYEIQDMKSRDLASWSRFCGCILDLANSKLKKQMEKWLKFLWKGACWLAVLGLNVYI